MAEWIRNRETDGNETTLTLFRKKVWWDGRQQASLRISADTKYKLWINGTLVLFGPAKGDRSVWFFDPADVTAYLVEGENTFAAEVLHYGTDTAAGMRSAFRSSIPGLYIESTLPGLDTDSSWKTKEDSGSTLFGENRFFSPLWIHEKVQGDRDCAGFMQPAFDDTDWAQAEVLEGRRDPGDPHPEDPQRTALPEKLLPGNLRERMIPLLEIGEERELLPAGETGVIPPHTERTLVIDAGEEVCSFLRLEIAGGKDAGIGILQAEGYVYDVPEHPKTYGEIPRKGDREDAAHGTLWGYTDSYTAAGTGTERTPEIYAPFWIRTYRYLKLTVRTKEEAVRLLSLTQRETGYPLRVQTRIHCENDTMNRIWDISLRTLRRCMLDTYVDCPFYEQLQYAMDARSEMRFTYAVSGDDRLARQCIDDFSRAQQEDGMMNCSYPDVGRNTIPGFTIYVIGMLYDHMWFFGDRALVARYLPMAERILGWFHRHLDERGLVEKVGGPGGAVWSFIDWTKEWSATRGVPTATEQGPITMESLLYAYGLRMTEELAAFAGKGRLRERCRQERLRVGAAVRTFCLDKSGMIQDGPGVDEVSQHCQVFAVLAQVLPKEALRENLRRTLARPEQYAQCSVAMLPYLFEALRLTGQYELTRPLWGTWEKMLDEHLSTCAEKDVNCRSDCHGWGALILYELPAVMLGVRPAKPGFEELEICPHPEGIGKVQGQVVTARGLVQVQLPGGEA